MEGFASRTFSWLNEPEIWSGDAERLVIATGKETDFWQSTFYGFRRDTGHAWLTPVSGDFSAEVSFTGRYETLYDQAGLMLRTGPEKWIKAGIEFTDGLMHLSTVVTNPVSDWSVVPLHHHSPAEAVHLRITRHDDVVRVQYHLGDGAWQMARLCPFTAADAEVGPTASSPQRAGFEANFFNFHVGAPIDRNLHAD
ncbi:MAG: DUF1349 domain-containing protein [Hyphomicrobiaceae bacterium]|nr:DUF1349 domain-containing protein [Hyphomicrobiaceae bacterium]